MAAIRPFRPIASAPTDIAVEVIHGARQAVTLAEWDDHLHLWVRAGGPDRHPLLRVTGWRHLAKPGSDGPAL